MYAPTIWEDHVTTLPGIIKLEVYDESRGLYRISEAGEVMIPGTPQDQTNYNKLEAGVLDAHAAIGLLVNYARQNGWEIERGTKVLTNSLTFPFNNSKATVALGTARESKDYLVLTELVSADGNPGEIEVSDKLTNGFKLGFTGSAASATVNYTVIGGFMK